MNDDNIERIGVWTLRIALVIGAVILGAFGKEEAASSLLFGLVMSFFFL